MRKILALSLLLSIIFTAGAQQLPMDPQVRHGKLSNGLTYFIQKNNNPENRAAYYLVQKVGSMQEEDSQSGLAHFLEHMAFGRTKNYPENLIGSFERYGAKIGPNINAYTSFDQTVYYLNGLPTTSQNVVDSCILVLHDWSGFISLPDDAIDRERKVIKEEWRTHTGAGMRIWDKQLAVLMKGTKYADRKVIGKMEVIDNFKYQELHDYYKKWYRPDLQAVIIVGDIDVDRVEKQLKTVFADIPKPVNPAKRIYYPVPDNTDPIVSVITDPEATSTNINLYIKHAAIPTDQRNTKDWLIQLHVKNMVTGMLSSRLNEIAQNPDAPFSGAYTYYGNYFVSSTKDAFVAGSTAKEGKAKEALAVLIQEGMRAKKHGFTDGEIERAKANLLKRYEDSYNNRNKRDNADLVNVILHNYLISGPITGVEYEYQMLKEVIPTLGKDVFNNFIKNAIKEDNVALIVSGPEKAGLTYPTESELIALMASEVSKPVAPYEDKVSKEPLVSNLPAPGKVVNETRNGVHGETVWTLSNGMKVMLKKTDFHNDQITMSSKSFGGTSLFPKEELVNYSFVNAVQGVGGIGNFSKIDLPKVLAGKSVEVWAQIGEFDQSIGGNTTKADLETMLQLTYLYFTSPRKDEAAFKAFVENRRNSMLNDSKNPLSIFNDSINKTLFGNQPRARKLEIEDLNKIDYDRLISMYKESFANPGSFTFTFVGTVDEATMKPLVEKYLGCLPSGNKDVKFSLADKKTARKGIIKNSFTQAMETPKANAFFFFSGCLDFDWKGKIAPAFKRDVLNGIMEIVFFRTLRGEEGGTYGAFSRYSFDHIPINGDLRLIVSFSTDPKRVDDMKAIVYRELNSLANDGPKQEDFEKAIEGVLKQRAEYMKMNQYWAATTELMHLYGEDENTDYINRVKAITPADIQQLMKDILAQGNTIEVVMTPKE